MAQEQENHSDARLVNYREREGKPDWDVYEPLYEAELVRNEATARAIGATNILRLIATIRALQGEVERLRERVAYLESGYKLRCQYCKDVVITAKGGERWGGNVLGAYHVRCREPQG